MPSGSAARRGIGAEVLPIAGSAGRYMSMANGPMADNSPSTRAALIILLCMTRNAFRSTPVPLAPNGRLTTPAVEFARGGARLQRRNRSANGTVLSIFLDSIV